MLDRRRLVESLVAPSREIAPQFVNWLIATKDGRVLSGVLLEESPLGEQVYVDAKGDSFTLKASEIESRRPQATSIMPDDLARLMTVQEFRDLLAYLGRLRDGEEATSADPAGSRLRSQNWSNTEIRPIVASCHLLSRRGKSYMISRKYLLAIIIATMAIVPARAEQPSARAKAEAASLVDYFPPPEDQGGWRTSCPPLGFPTLRRRPRSVKCAASTGTSSRRRGSSTRGQRARQVCS